MRHSEMVITRQELENLLEYSTSLPSGVIVGKRWRRATRRGQPETNWLIGEYVESVVPGHVSVRWTWAMESPGVPHTGLMRPGSIV